MRKLEQREVTQADTGMSLGMVIAATIGGGVGIGIVIVLTYAVVKAIRGEQRRLKEQRRKFILIQEEIQAQNQRREFDVSSIAGSVLDGPSSKGLHTPYPSLSGLDVVVSEENESGSKGTYLPRDHAIQEVLKPPDCVQRAQAKRLSNFSRRPQKSQVVRHPQLSAIIETSYPQTQSPGSREELKRENTSMANIQLPGQATNAASITPTTSRGTSLRPPARVASLAENQSVDSNAVFIPSSKLKTLPNCYAKETQMLRTHARSLSLSAEIPQGPSHPPPELPHCALWTSKAIEILERPESRMSLDSTSSGGSSILDEDRHSVRQQTLSSNTITSNHQTILESNEAGRNLTQERPSLYRMRPNNVHGRATLHSSYGSLGDNSPYLNRRSLIPGGGRVREQRYLQEVLENPMRGNCIEIPSSGILRPSQDTKRTGNIPASPKDVLSIAGVDIKAQDDAFEDLNRRRSTYAEQNGTSMIPQIESFPRDDPESLSIGQGRIREGSRSTRHTLGATARKGIGEDRPVINNYSDVELEQNQTSIKTQNGVYFESSREYSPSHEPNGGVEWLPTENTVHEVPARVQSFPIPYANGNQYSHFCQAKHGDLSISCVADLLANDVGLLDDAASASSHQDIVLRHSKTGDQLLGLKYLEGRLIFDATVSQQASANGDQATTSFQPMQRCEEHFTPASKSIVDQVAGKVPSDVSRSVESENQPNLQGSDLISPTTKDIDSNQKGAARFSDMWIKKSPPVPSLKTRHYKKPLGSNSTLVNSLNSLRRTSSDSLPSIVDIEENPSRIERDICVATTSRETTKATLSEIHTENDLDQWKSHATTPQPENARIRCSSVQSTELDQETWIENERQVLMVDALGIHM